MGLGLWSPPLDVLGNSVRGVNFAEVSLNSYHWSYGASTFIEVH